VEWANLADDARALATQYAANGDVRLLRLDVRLVHHMAQRVRSSAFWPGPVGSKPPEPSPTAPIGAKFFYQDNKGMPRDAKGAWRWCWGGGPAWFEVTKHPIPREFETPA
jgi:hypothetical protein